MKRLLPVIAALVLFQSHAYEVYYWDANGSAEGSGSTPGGIWGVDPYWNTNAAGTAPTQGWMAGHIAHFAAGNDATNPYTVTVVGSQQVADIHVSRGTVTFQGGMLNLRGSDNNNNNRLLSAGHDDPNTLATFNTILTGAYGISRYQRGTIVFGATNFYTGPTVIEGGIIKLGAPRVIPPASMLVLSNNNGRADVADLGLTDTPVTFATGGFSQQLGPLQLAGPNANCPRTLDFGDGASVLFFASSSGQSWRSNEGVDIPLLITNFTLGVDSLRFGTSSGGLTARQLGLLRFLDYGGAAGAIDVSGFVTPLSYALTAAPANSQVYPRDRQTSRAVVAYRGAVSSQTYDSLLLQVTRNGAAYTNVTQTLVFSNGLAAFDLSASIPAELANYGFTLYLKAGASQSQISSATNVVAGDAYLINGQSNAEAVSYSGSASANAHAFLRSFGKPAATASDTTADLVWRQAVGDAHYASAMVGQWGLKFGRMLLDSYQIPIAIINAAEPGQPITYFQRNDASPTDLGTNYGRLLYRVQQAGLTNGIRAILWYQGESDYKTSAAQHESGFLEVYNHWLGDYPGVEQVYVHQVREVAVLGAWTDGLDLRNRQRLFQRNYSNISVMSTTGIDAYGLGLWHYAYTGGYELIGTRIFNLVARDLYGGQASNVEAPDILYACFNNAAHDEIALVMANTSDTMTWGAGSQADFAVNGVVGAPVGGAASNNAVILKLSSPFSYGATVSYAGHAATVAPWVANAAGVGLLAFYNVPVSSPQSLSSPKLTAAPSINPGNLTLSFGTVPGWFYSVEYCTNLTASGWQPLPKYVWGTGAPIQVSTARASTPRFYRLRITAY